MIFNTTQKRSDNLPSYLQTNIIAQMSIGGEGQFEYTYGSPKLQIISTSVTAEVLAVIMICAMY